MSRSWSRFVTFKCGGDCVADGVRDCEGHRLRLVYNVGGDFTVLEVDPPDDKRPGDWPRGGLHLVFSDAMFRALVDLAVEERARFAAVPL